MLVVEKLARAFEDPARGRVEAVAGLSLRVERGEIYGLIGPNGAGKTTTLRLLATLLRPDGGSVIIDGVDARAEPVRARSRLAYVPAEAGLPERLTAMETISMFARIQGMDDPDARALALLERLGAASYAHSACSSLSTGMKRRIVLARALVHDPPVLLLDEPTDGLDVAGRREVLGLLRGFAKEGRSVIVSSHIMSEVENLCDRLGIVSAGKIVAEGSLDEIFATTGMNDLGDAFLSLISETSA